MFYAKVKPDFISDLNERQSGRHITDVDVFQFKEDWREKIESPYWFSEPEKEAWKPIVLSTCGISFYQNELLEANDFDIASYKAVMSLGIEKVMKAEMKSPQGLGAYAYSCKDDKFIHQNNIACHYSFGADASNRNPVIDAATWTLPTIPKKDLKSIRELVEWLMNDSPWLHCIARRWDILSAQERTDRAMVDPVPVDVNQPRNEVASFVVAMRTISEHAWTIPTYLALRERGASKALSFMLTAFVQLNKDGDFAVYPNYNWHHYTQSSHSKTDILKFFKHGFHLEGRDKLPFKHGRYSYIARQIASEGGDSSIQSLLDDCTTVTGSGLGKKRSLDICAVIEKLTEDWKKL